MYQPDTSAGQGAYNPYAHYPNHYPAAAAAGAATTTTTQGTTSGQASAVGTPGLYLPQFHHLQSQSQPGTAKPELDPPEPAVTPLIASQTLQKLVLFEVKNAGFDGAGEAAVQRLELELGKCSFFSTLSLAF